MLTDFSMLFVRQNTSSQSAAWRMLHSSVRRVDFVMGLVITMQDVISYFMSQPTHTDVRDPPFQLVRRAIDDIVP